MGLDEGKLKVTIPKIVSTPTPRLSASSAKDALGNLFARSVAGSVASRTPTVSTPLGPTNALQSMFPTLGRNTSRPDLSNYMPIGMGDLQRFSGPQAAPLSQGTFSNGVAGAGASNRSGWGASQTNTSGYGIAGIGPYNRAPSTAGLDIAGAGGLARPTSSGWTSQQTAAYNASIQRQGQNRTIDTPNGPYIVAGGADNMRGQAGSDYRSMFEWGASRGYTPGQITNVELQNILPQNGSRPKIEFNAQTTQAIKNANYGPGYDENGNMIGMVKPGFLGMNMPTGGGGGGGGYGGWGGGGDWGSSKSPWNWGSVLWRI